MDILLIDYSIVYFSSESGEGGMSILVMIMAVIMVTAMRVVVVLIVVMSL